MTEEEFCKLYTGYTGEEINKVAQLVQSNFTGEELKEFCDYIAESLSLPSVIGSSKLTAGDLETIKEHRDLMEDVRTGDYKPDSLTNQPINELIERLENYR